MMDEILLDDDASFSSIWYMESTKDLKWDGDITLIKAC